MMISCPPTRNPCYYGIDFPSGGELIANAKSIEEICEHLDLDSLHYLSIEGLLTSTGIPKPEEYFCKACFDGSYPVAFDENLTKECLEIS